MLSARPAVIDLIATSSRTTAQFREFLLREGVRLRWFRQAAGIWPLALGGSLSSAARDITPLTKQAGARYSHFRERTCLLCQYHSIVSLGVGNDDTMIFTLRILEGGSVGGEGPNSGLFAKFNTILTNQDRNWTKR